jgi:hypothetical protein
MWGSLEMLGVKFELEDQTNLKLTLGSSFPLKDNASVVINMVIRHGNVRQRESTSQINKKHDGTNKPHFQPGFCSAQFLCVPRRHAAHKDDVHVPTGREGKGNLTKV